MASLAEKFKNKVTKKVFSCPSCSKSLRVPVKPGKTLMVTCSGCQGQIQLSFKSPITELFKWEKGRELSYNLRMFSWRLKSLPASLKITLFIQFIVLIWICQIGFKWVLGPSGDALDIQGKPAPIVRKS
jgi:hypothetical protein